MEGIKVTSYHNAKTPFAFYTVSLTIQNLCCIMLITSIINSWGSDKQDEEVLMEVLVEVREQPAVVGDVLMGDLDLLGVALGPLVDQVDDDELGVRVLLLEDVVVDDDLGGLVLFLGNDDLGRLVLRETSFASKLFRDML